MTSLLVAGFSMAPALSAQEAKSSTGTGAKYQTFTERSTEGELSREDFRQASMLASQTLMHVNAAVDQLGDDQAELARIELDKASTLIEVLRDLLPVTTVDTIVKNAQGEEVDRHTMRVQEDQIPIFEKMIAIEVIEPVVEAKKELAALSGVRLADAELMHTSVLVDLELLERRLRRANRLLADGKTNDALSQLAIARTHGIQFAVNKQDDPLVEVQMALRLAERMAEDEKIEAARLNLAMATAKLELYRALIDGETEQRVRELDRDMRDLMAKLGEEDQPAPQIRGLWQRVTALFQQEPGQTQPRQGEGARAVEAAAPSGGSKK